jgi:hypothetical protein
MTHPIYFNVKEAREFLLATGFVYTLRKPRSVGKTVAVQGGYYNHAKLCDVCVFLVKEKVSIVDLYLHINKSGFDSIADWLIAAKIDDPASLSSFNLYRVVRVNELPHCSVLTNHTVRKEGSCTRFNACAGGRYFQHPYAPARVFCPNVTQLSSCNAQGQAGDSLARQEEKNMTSKKGSEVSKSKGKGVAREVTAPAPETIPETTVPTTEAKTEVAAKKTVTEEVVLAAMEQGKTYTSTDLMKHFGLSGRSAVRRIMNKLADDKKVVKTEVGEEGKRKQFAYKLA